MSQVELIPVAKDGAYLEVHPTTLDQHKGLGWRECAKQEGAEAKPSDGLKVEEIKAELEAKGIAIPDGVTKKADLAALLDAS
ncbi:hypothetical protein [Variovorax ginsengisoli]|uniref:HeH/LEM domain-containing protein n=1 Tax=Variovorax ginsengisoli TaxID=363844 RepID=A0ABT8RZS6_9BURK|nr:hypothetical protein [Variovorax ginsengisoli]MDN8612790.1 hypothetical protein [Variovorax ginsengisoli]MDO1531960.1 hypothetical protein [Variovorax ginsengisoli]